jgi:predicted nucleotidyltransferase
MNLRTTHFITELQQNPDVSGVLLFGSWARGTNRPDSDVDLLVIVRHGFARVVEERQGQAFEIIFTTEDDAIAFWRANPDDAADLWHHAQIVYDRAGTMERLRRVGQDILAQGKPPISAEQEAHARFDIDDQLHAIAALADTDPRTARLLLSAKVLQLTELYFDVRRLWRPPPKQRLGVLQLLDTPFYDRVAAYYDAHALPAQIQAARSIAAAVFDRGDGPVGAKEV